MNTPQPIWHPEGTHLVCEQAGERIEVPCGLVDGTAHAFGDMATSHPLYDSLQLAVEEHSDELTDALEELLDELDADEARDFRAWLES